jgi:hypothetical protein
MSQHPDWPTLAAESSVAKSARCASRREEEFFTALDRYMAYYAEQQTRHAEAGTTRRHTNPMRKAMGLLRQCAAVLAICETLGRKAVAQ